MGFIGNADATMDVYDVAPPVEGKVADLIPLKPLNDMVIIARLEPESVSRGGIYIPDIAKEAPCEGVVMAVGPGLLLENGVRAPMDVVPGDRVVFKKYAGAEEVVFGNTKLIAVKHDTILAKVLES